MCLLWVGYYEPKCALNERIMGSNRALSAKSADSANSVKSAIKCHNRLYFGYNARNWAYFGLKGGYFE